MPSVNYIIGFYGDLHIGNLSADIPGFIEITRKVVSNYKPTKYIMVLLGDVIEGSNKYRTQIYKMFNVEPLRIQLDYLAYTLNTIIDYALDMGVYINIKMVLGNHDLGYDYGNLIKYIARDEKMMSYSYDVLILNTNQHRILCKHQLNRMSRGSYLTWWTGYLLNLGERILMEYDADMLVTAHTHRPDIGIVYKNGRTYIGLPSFIVSNEDHIQNKILLYTNGWMKIEVYRKTDPYKLQEINIENMKKLLEQRKVVEEVNIE